MGFGTDAVVVYCQYVFVWHVNPGEEKIASSVLEFGTLILGSFVENITHEARTHPVLANE